MTCSWEDAYDEKLEELKEAKAELEKSEQEVMHLTSILYGGADWQEQIVAERDSYKAAHERIVVQLYDAKAERDRYRAALAGLLDAADHYCAMYQKHGGEHIRCGAAWARMYRERVLARETLGDD